MAFLRHRQLAVPAGGYLAIAQGGLVQVTYLTTGQAHQPAVHQPPRQFPGSARTDGIDPGMDLHPGGNAQHRLALARRGADIPRRTVAASEENQRHAGLLQGLDRMTGILGAGLRPIELAQYPVRKAHLRQQVGPHGTGEGEELDTPDERQQALQGEARAHRRPGFGASGKRLCGDPIAALERGRAAQAGQGIDDQAHMERGHAYLELNSGPAQGVHSPGPGRSQLAHPPLVFPGLSFFRRTAGAICHCVFIYRT
ncbi:hypothetical protein FQZ97_780820 [compost metagenome]